MKLHLKMLAKSVQIVFLGFLAMLMVCLMIMVSAAYGQDRVDENMARWESEQRALELKELKEQMNEQ